MFEFEDLSAGFHDIISNKYTDSSGPILDFYISDSMQDMLDIDIRSEVATVVGGGSNEFSSLLNDLPTSLDLDLGTNDGELSWLGGPKWSATTDIYADVGACVNPNSVMPLITSSLLNSSKAQINLNTTTSTTTNSKINNSPPASPKENKSHLTFSPHQMKVPSVVVQHENKQYYQRPSPLATTVTSINNNNRNLVENIKKDLSSTDLKNDNNKLSIKINNQKPSVAIPTTATNILSSGTGTNTIKLGPGIGGLTFSNISYNRLKQSNNVKLSGGMNGIANGNIAIKNNQKELLTSLNNSNQLLNNSGNIMINENNSNATTTHLIQQQNSTSNKILSRSILVQNNKMANGINTSNHHHHHHNHNHHQHHSHNTSSTSSSSNTKPTNKSSSLKPIEHEYPKPAYSYSCLIAMALKNSRSGSLPVSEIYSFMCEHFPYFKTAPNGWKNSVRHNLSLNKCFEKIEKPITNGGQRKGCLWAMNPAKIMKMDEEVQKWSRKDPMAIRKAMVYPENLEALERGEMKHGSTGDSDEEISEENDVQSEDNEENSESEHEEHDLDEHLVETQDEDDEHNGATIRRRERAGIDDDNKEFDVEVTDIYDAIDLEDDKDALHRSLQQHNQRNCDLSSDINDIHNSSSPSLSKKARLDVNYSISPAEIFEQRIQQQQSVTTTHHNRRKMPLVNRIA